MTPVGAVPTFGALLRSYREWARLSCSELARAIAVDPSYISRLERDERDPPRRVLLIPLADVLALRGEERAHFFAVAGQWPDEWSTDVPRQVWLLTHAQQQIAAFTRRLGE